MIISLLLAFVIILSAVDAALTRDDILSIAHYKMGTMCHVITGKGCNRVQKMIPTFEEEQSLIVAPISKSNLTLVSQNEGNFRSSVSAGYSRETLSDSYANSFGLSFAVGGALFSLDIGYKKAVSQIYESSSESLSVVGSTFISQTLWRVEGDKRNNVSPIPIQEIKDFFLSAPSNINGENIKKYWDFFDKYGTHYVSSVSLGGLLQQSLVTKSRYSNSSFVAQKIQEIGAAMKNVFDANIGYSSGRPSSYSEHSISDESSVQVFGGDVALFRNVYEWQKSIAENPTVTFTGLTFIGSLFPTNLQPLIKLAFDRLFQACPTDGSNLLCGGAGTCNFGTGRCECIPTRTGEYCQFYRKPLELDCGSGKWNNSTGLCDCHFGYSEGKQNCNCSRCGEHYWYDPRDGNGVYYFFENSNQDQCFCDLKYKGSTKIYYSSGRNWGNYETHINPCDESKSSGGFFSAKYIQAISCKGPSCAVCSPPDRYPTPQLKQTQKRNWCGVGNGGYTNCCNGKPCNSCMSSTSSLSTTCLSECKTIDTIDYFCYAHKVCERNSLVSHAQCGTQVSACICDCALVNSLKNYTGEYLADRVALIDQIVQNSSFCYDDNNDNDQCCKPPLCKKKYECSYFFPSPSFELKDEDNPNNNNRGAKESELSPIIRVGTFVIGGILLINLIIGTGYFLVTRHRKQVAIRSAVLASVVIPNEHRQ